MKSPICAAALAAAVALISLQACGGVAYHLLDRNGGNGQENGHPVTTEPPAMSSAEVKVELHAIYDRSDTFIVEHGGTPLWSGPREVFETSNLDNVAAGHLDDHLWGAPANYDFLQSRGELEFVDSEGGISVAAAIWDTTDHHWQTVTAHMSFGVWMTHSLILAKQNLVLSPAHDEISVYLDIFSIGAASGTNPFPLGGSATWNGIMLGFDEGYAGPDVSRAESGEPNVYEGEAAITLTSFADPAVDVRFSNITNTIHYLNDVVWRDLPVTEGGFKGRGILGRFYGPQHEEVGGVFQFSTINGAFGAVRQ